MSPCDVFAVLLNLALLPTVGFVYYSIWKFS